MKIALAAITMSWVLTSCASVTTNDPRYTAAPLPPSFEMRRDPGVNNTPLNMGNPPYELDPHYERYSYGW